MAESAYIAGIIDGEGTIGVVFRNPSAKCARATLSPAVAISICTPIVLDWIVDATGLGSRSPRGHRRPGNRAPVYRWAVTSAGAASLLEQIGEYLIIKCATAAALLRLHDELLRDSDLIRSHAWRNEVKKRFHAMNARGVLRDWWEVGDYS